MIWYQPRPPPLPLIASIHVAQAVLFVIANGYVTGQTVQVNGGLQFT